MRGSTMHKFTRCQAPINLSAAQTTCNTWKSFVGTSQHISLSSALYECQEHYCAYCERIIASRKDGQIEHLERRSSNPSRTFDWSNMFFSCRNSDSCGKYKDEQDRNHNFKRVFNINDVIDPSLEDPQDFFEYTPTGDIAPLQTATPANKHRAQETIRIFNLASSAVVCNSRSNAAQEVDDFLKNYEQNNTTPTDQDIVHFLNNKQSTGVDCISVYFYLLGRRMP